MRCYNQPVSQHAYPAKCAANQPQAGTAVGVCACAIHPVVIASRIGYTSVKTVLDVYGYLYEGLDRNAQTHSTHPGTDLM